MSDFKSFRRKELAELRPYDPLGRDKFGLHHGISVSEVDKAAGSPLPGDMIARNPKNHEDQWLVAKQYFIHNFEPCK